MCLCQFSAIVLVIVIGLARTALPALADYDAKAYQDHLQEKFAAAQSTCDKTSVRFLGLNQLVDSTKIRRTIILRRK